LTEFGPDFKDIDNLDIAPTVAELLGINPPKDSQGRKIATDDGHTR
jgi:hypothetical protein